MGILRRPDPDKLVDADIPIEQEVVCIIQENEEGEPAEKFVPVTKSKAVVTSTATGEQFGNWIPSLRSSGTIDIDVRNAFYTKIGQSITCTFDLVVTNMTERNNSSITLNGLPVNAISSSGIAGSAYFSYFKTSSDEIQHISGTINGNDNRIDLWCELSGRKGLHRLTQQDIQINTVLAGTVNYITNS